MTAEGDSGWRIATDRNRPTVSFASSTPPFPVAVCPLVGARDILDAGYQPYHGSLLG